MGSQIPKSICKSIAQQPQQDKSISMSVMTDSQFINKLVIVQSKQQCLFGQVKVFRLMQPPYDYIMKIIEHHDDALLLQQRQQTYHDMASHKNLVGIDAISLTSNQAMCASGWNLEIYVRYYNFTLDDAICLRRKRGRGFCQADVGYLFTSLLSLGKHCQMIGRKCYCGLFRSENIFLSPEGYVKIYPFGLPMKNKKQPHSQYMKLTQKRKQNSDSGSRMTKFASECEISLNTKVIGNNVPKVKDTKDDMKDIVVTMLQVVQLLGREYYVEEGEIRGQLIEVLLEKEMIEFELDGEMRKILKKMVFGEIGYEQIEQQMIKLKSQGKVVFGYYLNMRDEGSPKKKVYDDISAQDSRQSTAQKSKYQCKPRRLVPSQAKRSQ